jgi:hypothetical protein
MIIIMIIITRVSHSGDSNYSSNDEDDHMVMIIICYFIKGLHGDNDHA